MNRILSLSLLLAIFTASGFGVVVTTTINATQGANGVNLNVQAATNATENVIAVTITPGHAATIEFNNDGGTTSANANAWKYRTTTGVTTTDKSIPAATALKLRFTQSTNFYTVRQTADGVITATILLIE